MKGIHNKSVGLNDYELVYLNSNISVMYLEWNDQKSIAGESFAFQCLRGVFSSGCKFLYGKS